MDQYLFAWHSIPVQISVDVTDGSRFCAREMGVLLSLGRAGMCSCVGIVAMKKHPEVLQIVKPDGAILKYSSPILVRDAQTDMAVSGIGLFEGSSQHLPPEYELKMGEVYYVLPPRRPPDAVETKRVTRIKVVITKQQLQLLLDQQVSVEEVIARLDGKKTVYSGKWGDCSASTWRPSLETISEGID